MANREQNIRQPIKLTPEEKAVLLECRRNSLARGVPLGILSVLGLRYFVTQGRVSPHVQKWSIFYYSGVFIISCLMGVSSYKQKCLEKIMSLENSFLGDQLREQLNKQGVKVPSNIQDMDWKKLNSKTSTTTSQDSNSIADWNKDVEDKVLDQQVIAFNDGSTYNDSSEVSKKGRTFDEIREENRKRQLQQNFPSSSSREQQTQQRHTRNNQQQPASSGNSGQVVRRNKYGDIIYEDK